MASDVPLTSHCTWLSAQGSSRDDGRIVVMLDIDNTLYSKTTRINDIMQDLIQKFFEKQGLSHDEANELHSRYYKQYGLSIRGLIRHHSVDPLDYDRECDGAIPLEDILHPDEQLRQLLQRIDTSKARIVCLTNAYRHHAQRVLKLLNVADLCEAVISCDYAHPTFKCKPEKEYFAEACQHVGVQDLSRIRFVDDSALNVAGARQAGWSHSMLFDEDGSEAKKPVAKDIPPLLIINKLEQLPAKWPEVFLPATGS